MTVVYMHMPGVAAQEDIQETVEGVAKEGERRAKMQQPIAAVAAVAVQEKALTPLIHVPAPAILGRVAGLVAVAVGVVGLGF